jgi:hypothetical protein
MNQDPQSTEHEYEKTCCNDDRLLEQTRCRQYLTTLEETLFPVLLMIASNEQPTEQLNQLFCGAIDKAKLPPSYYNLTSVVIKRLLGESTMSQPSLKFEEYLRIYTKECTERTLQLYFGIMDTLYIHLSRLPKISARNNFLTRYYIFALNDIMEDKYKFHTGYLYTSFFPYSEKPIDKYPFEGERSGVVLGGWVKRFFDSKNVDKNLKVDVANSLQDAKRAAAAISKRKQVIAILDHQKAMLGQGFTRTPEQESHVPGVLKKFEELCKIYLPRTIENEIPIWRLPSQSACWQKSRKNSGTMGHFYDMFMNPTNKFDDWGMNPYELYQSAHHVADLTIENDIPIGDSFSYLPTVNVRVPIFSFGFNIYEIRKKLVEETARVEKCEAQFHSVLEPFKLRGITASDANVYHLGRLLQPIFHGMLRDENGPFRFIGKSNNEEDIRKVYCGSVLYSELDRDLWDMYHFRVMESMLYGGPYEDAPFAEGCNKWSKTFFVAGDFKAATDNMDPRFPKLFVDCLRRYTDLSPAWIRVADLTLGSHFINYPPIPVVYSTQFPEYKKRVEQEWGQLMGSPLSFIILCLTNAAMLWQASEIMNERPLKWWKFVKEYRPLFNGDDVSFLSNEDHYKIWKNVCTGCGLSLSPGKNYCTDEFVNINSTTYRTTIVEWNGRRTVVDLTETFRLNAGLIKGQSKVLNDTRLGGKITPEGLSPVCDQLNVCIRTAPEDAKERALEVFKTYLLPRLNKSHKSWCLPRHLGGLGLPFGSVNRSQMEIALQQLYKGYKDLSDDKVVGQFQEMAFEYWRCIRASFPEGVHIQMPVVLQKGVMNDPLEKYYDLPSLAFCFITDEERYQYFIEQERIEKLQQEGKKVRKAQAKHPEHKFLKLKRKYNPNNPKNILPLDRSVEDEELIQSLKDTYLIKGGSNKRIRVDVCRTSIEAEGDIFFDNDISSQLEPIF